MKIEQCPICYSNLEVKEFVPCDDCGGLEKEINHFKDGIHNYTVYEIYDGLELQLCNFCDVDFGSYKSEYLGLLSNKRIGYENFKFVSFVENPSIQKTKYCPECNKGLKFLTFLRDLRNKEKRRLRKSDKSKHNISIASIKRSTIKPYDDFKWTKFYESNSEFTYSGLNIYLSENEMIICSTVIDFENYSILTTQKLITNENGTKSSGNLINAKDKGYGDFKGYESNSITLGLVELENGTELKYLIETGKASMVMIHGVRTLIRIQKMSEQNI